MNCPYVCSLWIEPTSLALLTQCSTTEPQEHYLYVNKTKITPIYARTKGRFTTSCAKHTHSPYLQTYRISILTVAGFSPSRLCHFCLVNSEMINWIKHTTLVFVKNTIQLRTFTWVMQEKLIQIRTAIKWPAHNINTEITSPCKTIIV